MALLWRIYYSDGSTFSNEDGAWEDAPDRDVQVVLFRDAMTGWAVRHGGDYFRLAENGAVVAMDETGMIDHVVHELGAVKQGRMLTQAGFDRVYQQAKADMAALKAG